MIKPSPSKRYLEFIQTATAAPPTLPAMHTCYGRNFVSIMDSGVINVGPDDPVIKKPASFFFYGKPSYKPRSDRLNRDTVWSALFTFILDYEELGCPDSMLPFDSGGYAPLYREHCEHVEIDEFYLPKKVKSPPRFVTAFFGDNFAYYQRKLRPDLEKDLSALDLHSDSYRRICSMSHGTKFDQRASSIELHFVAPIKLSKKNFLGLVGPDTVLELTEVKDFAKKHRADLIPYPLDLDGVDGRQRQVRDAAKTWLESSSFM